MEKKLIEKQKIPEYIFYALCGYAFFSPFSITLGEIFFIVGLILWGFDIVLNKTGIKKNIIMPVALPLAVFAVWHLVCALLGLDILNSLQDWRKVYLFLMVFLAAEYLLRDSKKTRLLADAFISGIFIVSGYAIVCTVTNNNPDFRPASFSGNYMHLGGMLMMGFVVCLSLLVNGYKDKNAKFLRTLSYGVALLVIATALIMTKTRGSWLGAMVGFLIITLLIDRRLIIAVVLIVVTVFFTVKDNTYIERFKDIVRVKKGSSAIERIYMWQSGVEMIKDRPVFGIGTANVGKVYPKYRKAEAIEDQEGHLHNNFIQVAVIDGIPGFIFFIWIFSTLIFVQVRAVLKNKKNVLLLAGAAVSLAFFVNGFFEYNLFSSQVALMFWFITGASLAQVRDTKNA
ncbi:MAG: O-antigen ligase family protein [bacterium]